MPHPLHTSAVDLALTLHSVACEVTPLAATGTFASRVVVRPEKDEVAEFPELRGIMGAERPAWALNFLQSDYSGRPVAGDRLTIAAGVTYQLRAVQSDRLQLRWLCSGFIVEAEATEPDTLEPSVYMPAGLGFATAGSLLS